MIYLALVILPLAVMWAALLVITCGSWAVEVVDMQEALFIVLRSCVRGDWNDLRTAILRVFGEFDSQRTSLLAWALIYVGPLAFQVLFAMFTKAILCDAFSILRKTVTNEVTLFKEVGWLVKW